MLIYKCIFSPAVRYDKRWRKNEKIRKKSSKVPLKVGDMKAGGSEGLREPFFPPLINVQNLTSALAPNNKSHKEL